MKVGLADGVWYSRDCLDCGLHIGVAIVGENGASLEEVQQHPEDMICPFCDGQAKYTTQEQVDNLFLYRQPIIFEKPTGDAVIRKILSVRLHRPRRCLTNKLRSAKKQLGRIFR